MATITPTQLIGTPGDDLVEALKSVVAEDLRVVGEYNASTYNLLYVSDDVLRDYGNTEDLRATADQVHRNYHLDQFERSFLESELPYGDLATLVAYFDEGLVLRTFTSTAEVYIATDLGASVDDMLEIIRNALEQ